VEGVASNHLAGALSSTDKTQPIGRILFHA